MRPLLRTLVETHDALEIGRREVARLRETLTANLDQLLLGVRFIQDALAGGRKLLLHGPKGVHRTRPLLAGHLLAEGKSLARTLRIVDQGPPAKKPKAETKSVAPLPAPAQPPIAATAPTTDRTPNGRCRRGGAS